MISLSGDHIRTLIETLAAPEPTTENRGPWRNQMQETVRGALPDKLPLRVPGFDTALGLALCKDYPVRYLWKESQQAPKCYGEGAINGIGYAGHRTGAYVYGSTTPTNRRVLVATDLAIGKVSGAVLVGLLLDVVNEAASSTQRVLQSVRAQQESEKRSMDRLNDARCAALASFLAIDDSHYEALTQLAAEWNSTPAEFRDAAAAFA